MQQRLPTLVWALIVLLLSSTKMAVGAAFTQQNNIVPLNLHYYCYYLGIRGGGSSSRHEEGSETYTNDDADEVMEETKVSRNGKEEASQNDDDEEEGLLLDASAVLSAENQDTETTPSEATTTIKRRRTSEIILDLIDESSNTATSAEKQEVSDSLRLLMMERRDQVLAERNDDTSNKEQPPNIMKRVLHYLAPKIPAIRQSPDVALAVRALASDVDAGLAASLVATLAHLWEILLQGSGGDGDGALPTTNLSGMGGGSHNKNAAALVAAELVHDRRFEQLIETIVCGVDVAKRKQEALDLQHRAQEHGGDGGDDADDLVSLIQHAQISEGLSIRDSCRAAWGVAMLGLHDVQTIGETVVSDLLVALALRTRELLLGRVRLLCQDDFYVESSNSTVPVAEQRIMQIAQEIAEDTATAMWVFGCVQAVTGIKVTPLFHVCASILYHDPFQLRTSVQEAIETFDEPVVGGSDIIEKLDRAERSNDETDSPTTKRNQDVFLDWLSPTEVTDVLWALAVYASKESGSMNSTIAILSDIAIDRVIEWLAHDLKHGEISNHVDQKEDNASSEEPSMPGSGEVAASEILEPDPERPNESTESTSFHVPASSIEEETLRDFENAEVVDAAAILASESRQNDDTLLSTRMSDSEATMIVDDTRLENTCADTDSSIDDEIQMVDAAALLAAEKASENHTPLPEQSESDPVHMYLTRKSQIDWLFSAHDLCSLSWAATELRDSLKSRTTQMVSDLLVLMGSDHVATCSTADYSNLIWAIAKESVEKSSPSSPKFATLGRWIAENVFHSSGLADAVIDSNSWTLLEQSEPPELSRLLWSLASLSMMTKDKHLSSLVGVLSLAGLETASRNLPMFSSEDLASICWAFVEFSDYEAVLKTHPSSLRSLGRVLGVIDMALTSWEAGHSSAQAQKEDDEGEHAKEAYRFTSFFGRARSHISRLERKIEEMADDMEEYPTPSLLVERARLPLLKDFPVDPATLCKLCGSLCRPGSQYSEVCDTHTIAKATIRLMTSRNGRLLRECHINDLTSLCVAAVSDKSTGNRELIGLFARRAVKVLNDHPSMLEIATAPILSKLLRALGDLGAKYDPEGDSENAHRRLHLTARLPFSDVFAFDQLSDESLLSLMRGLARMNATSSEESVVARALEELDRRFPKVIDRIRLDDALGTVVQFRPSSHYMVENTTDANTTVEMTDVQGDEAAIGKIPHHTANLLHQIADATVVRIGLMESSELRSILRRFVALPFPVDDLVAAAEEEINRRQAALDENTQAFTQLKDAIQKIHPDTLKQLADSAKAHPSKMVKKMLRTFIREQKERRKDNESSSDDTDASENTHPSLDDILSIIFAATEVRDSQVDFPAGESDRVEFGRIQELISQYRRIDFESGERKSRFNKEGQRLMAKRMMSRLLP